MAGGHRIAVVVPAYRVERSLEMVLAGLPPEVTSVVVVDDGSPDGTAARAAELGALDPRVVLIRHERNRGVGAAMVTGFRKALELGAQVVVKVDGDGQMDPGHLPSLLAPLLAGAADYTKGNRFRDFPALRQMPLVRRLGNMALGFLAKAATGYWQTFDPTNGFVAIRSEVLLQLPLDEIDDGYYFEISMLGQLHLVRAVVKDVPMPARYREEVSSLLIHRVLLEFPGRLLRTFFRRLWLENFIHDFSMASVYLLTGPPLLASGLAYGLWKWVEFARRDVPAPAGTVVLPALAVILGFQLLLSAIALDLQSVPREPLTRAL